jgi:hypothetical protein
MGTNLTTFIKILFFVFIGLIAVTGLLMIDDELSQESKLLLRESPKGTDNTGYFYLMGIMAAPNEDPIEVGKTLFASIQHKKEKGTISLTYEKYPEEKKLAIPEGDLYCKFHDENCIKSIFQNIKNFNENDNDILLNRYLSYLSFNDHKLITHPHIEEPLPPYNYLIIGARIFLLKNIQISENGNPDLAITNTEEHIKKIRKRMANSDNLIAKMVYASILSQMIDSIYFIKKGSNNEKLIYIEPLNSSELSFNEPMKREFKGMENLFRSMDRNGNFLGTQYYIPGFLVRCIYKPNMTLNLMAPDYLNLIESSLLEPFELVAIRSTNDTTKNKNKYSIRNIVGNTLSKIGQPNFSKYIFRLHDLNIKITLFNKTVNLKTDETKNVEIENPYYRRMEKPTIIADKLCLNGPLEDHHAIRCTPLI